VLVVGIGSAAESEAVDGVGAMLGIVPEVVGVGIEAVAGFGTGPAAVDAPGIGIGPSATFTKFGCGAGTGMLAAGAFPATGDKAVPAAVFGGGVT
jgi:hypothetical protein